MARKTIFLETAFWEKFSECARHLNPISDDCDLADTIEKINRWNNLFRFICTSVVYTDVPLNLLGEKAIKDPMLRHLLKSSGDGKTQLDYFNGPFPDIDNHDAFHQIHLRSAAFLTIKDHQISARKRGVLNICRDKIWNQSDKFIDSGVAVKKDEDWTWRTMEILRENSNGLVIVDNFILSPQKNGKCVISFNLKEILKIMLPETSDNAYPISIFYYEGADSKGLRKDREVRYYSSILSYVNHIRPKLSIILELFPTATNEQSYRKDFHDRAIITNNIWLGSEAGFDLLVPDQYSGTNATAIKTTKTHGLYLGFGNDTAKWLDKSHDQLIEEAKQCLLKYNYTTKNHLLL